MAILNNTLSFGKPGESAIAIDSGVNGAVGTRSQSK